MKVNSTTQDLANTVFNKLKGAKVKSSLPNEETLNRLFENLFYTSIKTEESEFIKVTVTLISCLHPDPKKPRITVKNRWNYVRFDEKIEFNVKNVVKLSKAADPWSSSLAVDFDDDNNLFIWGLIDQSVHYQSFLHYESDSGPEQPGLFQTSITGIGNLVVIFDYELIATLKQNVLVNNYLDVFTKGNVFELIQNYTEEYKKHINEYLLEEFTDKDSGYWDNFIENIWTQTLSRILIRIQNYQHGGAFVITNDFETNLNIKHAIEYDRLFQSICNLTKLSIDYDYYSNTIYDKYFEGNKDRMSTNLYINEWVSKKDKEETSDELKGCIRFIASLSCIDGLVVFDQQLKVKGFGAVINNIDLPEYIYLSKTSKISLRNLMSVNPNHFGTRHRSMFSFCYAHPGSLGFVVSQDGDIRVITRIDDKLIMWENIKVQQLIRSNKLKRTVPRVYVRK